MPALRSSAVMLSLAAACSSAPIYFSPPPETSGAQSLILFFESGDSKIVVAMNLDHPEPAAVVYRGDDVNVYSFAYRARLEELGWAPGRLRLQVPGDRLPRPLAAKKNVVLESGETGWTTLQDPSDVLSRIEVEPRTDPCLDRPQFAPSSFQLSSRTNGRSVVPFDAVSALLTAQDHTFYRFSQAGLELLDVPRDVPTYAFRAVDGELWLGGKRGELWRGTIQSGFSYVATASTGGELAFLGGPTVPGVPFELFAISSDGSVHHFDGASFRRITRGLKVLDGGVAWIGPGKAYIARHSSDQLLEIDGTVMREENPTGLALEVTSIAYAPGLGVMVGTSAGTVHLEIDGEWVKVGESADTSIQELIPYEDGFFVGGEAGHIGTYRPNHGLCIDQTLASSVERAVVLGEDIAISHPNKFFDDPIGSPEPTFASWLKRSN